MLTVEHLAAEALRRERMRAYRGDRSEGGLHWFLEIFGFHAPKRS